MEVIIGELFVDANIIGKQYQKRRFNSSDPGRRQLPMLANRCSRPKAEVGELRKQTIKVQGAVVCPGVMLGNEVSRIIFSLKLCKRV